MTDFPDEEIIKTDKVIAIPHLGASTEKSEENCAIIASMQLMDFLEADLVKKFQSIDDIIAIKVI
jgi:D-3-phosphoglycerate dehydrogenase